MTSERASSVESMSDAGDVETERDRADREARAAVWRRDEPDSPCVQICVMHPTEKLCMGCGRTGEEISRWAAFTPEQRRELLAALPDRMTQLARAGGRTGRRRAVRRGAAPRSDDGEA